MKNEEELICDFCSCCMKQRLMTTRMVRAKKNQRPFNSIKSIGRGEKMKADACLLINFSQQYAKAPSGEAVVIVQVVLHL